jgi:hypothetical protein
VHHRCKCRFPLCLRKQAREVTSVHFLICMLTFYLTALPTLSAVQRSHAAVFHWDPPAAPLVVSLSARVTAGGELTRNLEHVHARRRS